MTKKKWKPYIDRATFERLERDQQEAGRIMHAWVIDPKTAAEGWGPKKKGSELL